MTRPTDEQIRYAKEIAGKLGIRLKEDDLSSTLDLARWAKNHRNQIVAAFGYDTEI